MKKTKLGELTEQELLEMTDFMASEDYDRMPAGEFFKTLKAIEESDVPERVVIRGRVENGHFIPQEVEGAVLEGHRIRIDHKAIIEIEVEAA